jgi:bacterioferritin-associated ferredoxin
MIVCSCNVLSDGAVRGCLSDGPTCPRTPAQVYACLGCSPKCGRCARTIREIMRSALGEDIPTADPSHSCTTACASACTLVKVQRVEERVGA